MKRRWDDDVVFKNQARGTEDKGKKKEFVNVSLFLFVLFLHSILPASICILPFLLEGSFKKTTVANPNSRISSVLISTDAL
jgi:hypothetical protein